MTVGEVFGAIVATAVVILLKWVTETWEPTSHRKKKKKRKREDEYEDDDE
jgi:uncharacterized protein (DUF2062 family)